MDRFLSSATPDEREALLEAMNELQVKEMQVMFNSLAQKCFNRCVNNFRARSAQPSTQPAILSLALLSSSLSPLLIAVPFFPRSAFPFRCASVCLSVQAVGQQ